MVQRAISAVDVFYFGIGGVVIIFLKNQPDFQVSRLDGCVFQTDI